MPLNDRDRFEQSIHSFDWIRDAAPGATDLDCFIEVNDHFLLFEGKRWEEPLGGVSIPLGQYRALKALDRVPAFTIYIVGECGEGHEPRFKLLRFGVFPPYEKGAYRHFPAGLFQAATEDDMRQVVRRWIVDARRALPPLG
jgi:hypothetical protein